VGKKRNRPITKIAPGREIFRDSHAPEAGMHVALYGTILFKDLWTLLRKARGILITQ
jgi:hypothetical protein